MKKIGHYLGNIAGAILAFTLYMLLEIAYFAPKRIFKSKAFTREVKETYTKTDQRVCKRRIGKIVGFPAGKCISSNEEDREKQSESGGD